MNIKYWNISREELYKIAEDKNTINLVWYKSPKMISKERNINKHRENISKLLLRASKILWVIWLSLIILSLLKTQISADNRDTIREARFEACQQAYNEYKDWIEKRYIHTNQNWVARCATYSTLVFAKETWFWQSRMCLQDNNCHWIKQPTYDIRIDYIIWNNRFLIFNNKDDSNLAFARLYARFHMNKISDTFVRWVWHNWQRVGAYSLTNQDTYVQFISDRYWETYEYFINL